MLLTFSRHAFFQVVGLMVLICAQEGKVAIDGTRCLKLYAYVGCSGGYERCAKECQRFGGGPVAMKTAKEFENVKSVQQTEGTAWIGGWDESKVNYFRWPDGRPVTQLSAVKLDEPTNEKHCLVFEAEAVVVWECLRNDTPRAILCEFCIAITEVDESCAVYCIHQEPTLSKCRRLSSCKYTFGNLAISASAGPSPVVSRSPCPNDRHGENCSWQCYCKDDAPCDLITGGCFKGCAPGWQGWACNLTKCLAHRWGPECQSLCFCSLDQQCTEDEGLCLVGCQQGSGGQHCTRSPCPPRRFGPECKQVANCKDPVYANQVTGICLSTSGCLSEDWLLENCSVTRCPPGYYGNECERHCFCSDRVPCDVTSGTCSNGCKAGWAGRKCDKPTCPTGYYGVDCTDICQCKLDVPCHRETGDCMEPTQEEEFPTCLQAGKWGKECTKDCVTETCDFCDRLRGELCVTCKAGYLYTSDGTCSQPCKVGRYGEKCQNLCSQVCENSDICDAVTGDCLMDKRDSTKGKKKVTSLRIFVLLALIPIAIVLAVVIITCIARKRTSAESESDASNTEEGTSVSSEETTQAESSKSPED